VSPKSARRFGLSLALFVGASAVYSLTRAPGITFAHRGADGGDFLAAAATWGVPHPPGYPTYTLVLRLFMALPVGEPAAAGNLLSTVMGAVAVVGCGSIIWELIHRQAHGRSRRRLPLIVSAGALTFGFFPLVWSQALVTEVYSFHLALVAVTLALLLRWRRTGKGLAWSAFLFGLGLTHHLTMAFVAPAALAILVGGRHHLVDTVQSTSGKVHFRWHQTLSAVPAFLLGLAPYAYAPLAARRLPPINWENPQTWRNFQRMVFAIRYRQNLLEPTPSEVLARVGEWLHDFPPTYFLPFYLLVVVGLLWLLLRDPAGGVSTALLAALVTGYALGYGTSDYWVNLLPVMMMVAVWLACGFWLVAAWLGRQRWRTAAHLAVLIPYSVPLALLVTQWGALDVHQDRGAIEYVEGLRQSVEPDALVFARGDEGIFGAWYARYALPNDAEWVPILHTFLHSLWYRTSLEANHTGLDLRSDGLGEEALITMVQRHLGKRPILLTWEDEELAQRYTLIQSGPLWKVEPRSGGLQP